MEKQIQAETEVIKIDVNERYILVINTTEKMSGYRLEDIAIGLKHWIESSEPFYVLNAVNANIKLERITGGNGT